MKTVLFLIALMLVAAPQALAAGKTMVYRNFIWGVSKEDVRRYEKAVFYKEEGNSLYFLLKPDRFRRMIRYDFKGDKLTGIRFEVVEYREAISGNVVNMFYDVEKELTGFYGPPKSEAFWKNKRYQKYPAYWGRPLYSGDLRLKNSWNLPDATVEEHAYYDGMMFQLFYTIVKKDDTGAPSGNAIDLPAAPASAASQTNAPPVTQP